MSHLHLSGWRALRWLLVVALALLLLAAPATRAAAPVTAAQDADPAAWLDPLVAAQMAQHHVPGAALVLVQHGQVVYARGYGVANVERSIPVDPDATIFRAMSVSKLLTATAVMQLVEQGRVRLDADVNTYLVRDPVAPTFPQPITLADLLTHRSGFDSDNEDIATIARAPSGVLPLADYLAAHPPLRIQPPGQRFLYTNADYDLLGLVVEQVAGQPFADYMAEHVLRPLGMDHSTFRPDPASPNLATSYLWTDGGFQLLAAHYFSNTPSRGLTTTAGDMAHFIQAQLGHSRSVLQPATRALMQQRHSPGPPDLPDMAYGFFTFQLGEFQSLWHDGEDPDRWNTKLVLYPNQDVGYFVATNAAGGAPLIAAVANAMDRRYGALPAVPATPLPPAGFAARASKYVGDFQPTDYAHHTLAKLLLLRQPDASVTSSGDGTLVLRFSDGAGPYTLVETTPNVFRAAGAYQPAVFEMDADGQASHLAWDTLVWERIPWYQTTTAQQAFAAAFAGLFLLGTLAGPVWLLSRRRRRPPPRLNQWVGLAGLAGWLVATLNLVFLAGVVLLLRQPYEIGVEYGVPAVLLGLLWLPLLSSALAVGLLVGTGLLWLRRAAPVWARLAGTLLALLALAFIPFLNYWNLLGFRW